MDTIAEADDARLYDAGRSLPVVPRSDLLDSAPTVSPYAYADNRPMLFIDPDGRAFFLPLLGAVAVRGIIHQAGRAATQGGELCADAYCQHRCEKAGARDGCP